MVAVRGRLDPYPEVELNEANVVTLPKGIELATGDVEPEETAPGDKVPVPVDGTVLFVSGKGTDGKPGVEVGSAEPIGPPVPADPGTNGVLPVTMGTVELDKRL